MTPVQHHQFLTFVLGGEVYAVDVAATREVVDFCSITPLPQTPDWIRGVLNLRGNVIPVLDLKQRLGMGITERTKNACILILELMLGGEPLVMGILADAVREVLEIDQSQIDPPPRLGTNVSTAYIRGMGRRPDGFFIILDVDRVFASSDIALASDSASSLADGATPAVGEPRPDADPGMQARLAAAPGSEA